jgi:hypothetical protein
MLADLVKIALVHKIWTFILESMICVMVHYFTKKIVEKPYKNLVLNQDFCQSVPELTYFDDLNKTEKIS